MFFVLFGITYYEKCIHLAIDGDKRMSKLYSIYKAHEIEEDIQLYLTFNTEFISLLRQDECEAGVKKKNPVS